MNSPRKKPHFTPRKAVRAASPARSDDDGGFDDAILPQGCALILRSVYVPGAPITTTSAALIAKKFVDELLESDQTLPSVTITPFSPRKPSSSCYLRIMEDIEDPDSNPRFDLLEIWLAVFRERKPEWEIAWQPLAEGRDKRMTIRLAGTEFKSEGGVRCPALEKAKAALENKGIPFTDAYSLSSGSHITLADHRHVDDIIQAGVISIPSLSKDPIPVTRSRQIVIEHCFEVVITGLSEGEGLQSKVCSWIARMIRDPSTDQSCFVGCRHPPESDNSDFLIVWLSDWAATARLLSMGEKMKQYFLASAPSFHVPQLVLAFNKAGAWRAKPLAQTFREGADSMNDALRSLRADLHEFKRETRAQHESTQQAVAVLSKSVGAVSDSVSELSGRLSNHASALLAMSVEVSTRSKLSQLELMISYHQSTMRFGLESERAEAEAEYLRLRQEQNTLMQTLGANAGAPAALLGGTLGSALGPPQVPPGFAPRSTSEPHERPISPGNGGNKRQRSDSDHHMDQDTPVPPPSSNP